MKFSNTVDISSSLVDRGFAWFQKYYTKVLKDKVTESPEEIYMALGGDIPEKKTKASKKPATK